MVNWENKWSLVWTHLFFILFLLVIYTLFYQKTCLHRDGVEHGVELRGHFMQSTWHIFCGFTEWRQIPGRFHLYEQKCLLTWKSKPEWKILKHSRRRQKKSVLLKVICNLMFGVKLNRDAHHSMSSMGRCSVLFSDYSCRLFVSIRSIAVGIILMQKLCADISKLISLHWRTKNRVSLNALLPTIINNSKSSWNPLL